MTSQAWPSREGLRQHLISRPNFFLPFLQLLELGFGGIIFIQWIAAGNQAVAGRCGAITEGAADLLRCDPPGFHRFSEHVWITQDHAAQSDHVRPAVAHDGLRNVRQVFLQVAISGAY